MMKCLIASILFLVISSVLAYAQPVVLELAGNHEAIPPYVRLSDQDQLWLAQKQVLTVAIFSPESEPLALSNITGRYRGVNADYLALLQKALRIKIIVKLYPDEQQALSAVKSHHADLMLTQLSSNEDIGSSFIRTRPLVRTYPTLVTAQSEAMQPLYNEKAVTIAITGNYPTESFIKSSFPRASIVSFPRDYEALSSVISGKSDYYIGNNLSCSSLIAQDFNQALSMVKFWRKSQACNRFIALHSQARLIGIINTFIDSVTDEVSNQVTQSWVEDGNLSFLTQPLVLSPHEQRWLKSAQKIRVLINPYNTPFTMMDSSLEIRGLVGDIFNLIHLQTGLEFEPVVVNSSSEMYQSLQGDGWDLQPTATYNNEQENTISFTHPYLSTYYVAVVKDGPNPISTLSSGMKVAIPKHHALYHNLKIKYPQIEWMQLENSGTGLNMVENGQIDATIYTQISARYMIDHYYPNKLTYFRISDEKPAAISFAVPRAQQELLGVLNKALDDIPPKEIARLAGKWTKMPNIQIDTWDLYKKQFYIVSSLSALFVFSSLLWGFYLLREIRMRKQSQADLEYQLNFRHTLANAIPMPNYVISLDGVLNSYNSAFTQFFSLLLREDIKLSLFDSRHPLADVFANIHDDLENYLLPNEVISHQLILNNGVEERHILHWSTLCAMPSNSSSVIICGWQDITESRQLMSTIQVEKDKAIQANLAKSVFLASMSHEIRTPISAIMGFLELLATCSQKPEEDEESIQLAYSTAQSLLGLIGNVLDMEKIESGHFELTPEWVDPELLITTVLRTFEGLAMQKQLKLTFINRLVPDELLWLDPQALRQALANLISNAVKFTTQGSIEIYASMHTDDMDITKLKIRVSDTGAGISLKDQQKLFKPFSQTHEGKQQTGSGLGLMICRQLVRYMEGDIQIFSQLDQGTIITITLTTSISRDKAVTEPTLLPINARPKELRILIADDHPTNRLLLKRQLDSLGYNVDEAVNGVQALALAKENTYDLLITDVNMPQMDGTILTRHIRTFDEQINIWGLTANAQIQERERCLEIGMNLCLFKPVTLQQLESSLRLLTTQRSSCRMKELINLDMLKTLTMGEPNLTCQMLTKSQQENIKDFASVSEAVYSADWSKLQNHLHRIKGAAQILGATKLQELSEKLAQYSQEQLHDSEVQEHLLEMDAFLQTLSDEIDRFCSVAG